MSNAAVMLAFLGCCVGTSASTEGQEIYDGAQKAARPSVSRFNIN